MGGVVGCKERRERGSALLLALVLSTTFGLLAMALLAANDAGERVQRSTGEGERAELAAASGIEWATALAMASGRVDARLSVELLPGVSVAIDSVATTRSPQLKAIGTCQGVTVTLGADVVEKTGGALPYAFASFGGSAGCGERVKIDGSAYLGDATTPIAAASRDALELNNGDAALVTKTPVASGKLIMNGYTVNYGTKPLANPTVDTTTFVSMVSGAVPVTRFTGTTTIKRQTLAGIVIVELTALQSLTLDDSTIDGTLVVRSATSDAVGSGKVTGVSAIAPQVRFVNMVTINGGTATTGNLALLAPECVLVGTASTTTRLIGVSYAWAAGTLDKTAFQGQLVLATTFDTAKAFEVKRDDTFVPSTPIGIAWPGVVGVRVTWLGRQ